MIHVAIFPLLGVAEVSGEEITNINVNPIEGNMHASSCVLGRTILLAFNEAKEEHGEEFAGLDITVYEY